MEELKPEEPGNIEVDKNQSEKSPENTVENKEAPPTNQGTILTKYLEDNKQKRILTEKYLEDKETLILLQSKINAENIEDIKPRILEIESKLGIIKNQIIALNSSVNSAYRQIDEKNKEWVVAPDPVELVNLEQMWMSEGEIRNQEIWEQEAQIIATIEKKEVEPEIAEFETMIENFKSNFSLEELHSITNISDSEAESHPLWWPAKLALLEIGKKITILKKETNIAPEKMAELQSEYKIISRAVGIRNKGIVDHTR